jgi:FtsP/CotA-like multicopper oxidase with cupredoxin domain
MHQLSLHGTLGLLIVAFAAAGPAKRTLPVVQSNANTERAGVLRNGVLTVTLEARASLLQINGPDRPSMTIEAFGEPGGPPLMPGPLVRANAGTVIRLTIRNTLSRPITFFMPAVVRGGPDRINAMDSIVVEPGAIGALTTRATTPGNYVYRAIIPHRGDVAKRVAGLLAGGLIVDSAGSATPHDRVFVIMQTWDSVKAACADTAARPNVECLVGRIDNTINGRSWPNTERVVTAVGDSLHWRVINAGGDVHPMHLHGFYYRVDEYSGSLSDVEAGRPAPGQMVATLPLPTMAGMSLTWSPDRPGHWLFHCHFAVHLQPDSISRAPDDPYMRDMIGLVIGISVAPRPGVQVAGEPTATRHLRLIALEDSTEMITNSRVVLPSMRFLLEEGSHRIDAGPDFSPELDLVRGEPVAITIVNRMTEPTTIHWHGIEVEDSYMDGVAGFSGTGKRRAPEIAPGDSFVARFTPPRAGTFMYHAHVDDNREQTAGLIGAIVVRDPGAAASPDDHVFFLKSSRLDGTGSTPVEINGQLHPDTIVMHAGRPARLRFINLSSHHNSARATFQLEASDGENDRSGEPKLVRWQPIAKDGFDLPASGRAPRMAQQVVAIGETYDFGYTPDRPGMLRLQVTTTPGPLQPPRGKPLIAVPIRVE